LGKTVDLKGIGYNTNQSEIAIGSEDGSEEFSRGQTKGGFVPEQHTDYIFTVGEEWGFRSFCSNHFICYLIS
jgi:rod shape determining protein RodA